MSKSKFLSRVSDRVRSFVPMLEAEERAKFRVKQEFKDEVNINRIVSRMKAGIHPPTWMTSKTPRFGDFSNAPCSFQDAYQVVQDAEDAFASLPLDFRRELDHDPRRLFDAPKELFAKHGLLQKTDGPEAPKETLGRASRQRVEGDRGLPQSAPRGPNKKSDKTSDEPSDEG